MPSEERAWQPQHCWRMSGLGIEDRQTETLSVERVIGLLTHGDLALEGQVPWSSNYAFIATVRGADMRSLVVYKPSRGARPLWDFAADTLCRREVAAYLLSQFLGWPDIPPVVLRDGPYGFGSVQLYVDADLEQHFFTMRDNTTYSDAFQRISLFDYLVNNADRKGGHVLQGTQPEARVWAIDHGLTFHSDYKLRTVIWDYAGQQIPDNCLEALQSLYDALSLGEASAQRSLSALLDPDEVTAVRERTSILLRHGFFPHPKRDWRNVPYPLV